MRINDNYKLTSDNYNITLEKKYIGKTEKNKGEELWKAEGFYPNYKMALSAMVNKAIMGIDDVKLICDKLDQLEMTINNLKLEG